ncbi:unnamed protein product [Sphagnum jensenii]|uniref:Uncharacterized protein n=1 Tax=Sphagnum jensenii TaxID=128206 RepID=A0ABP1AZH5_9BRYO
MARYFASDIIRQRLRLDLRAETHYAEGSLKLVLVMLSERLMKVHMRGNLSTQLLPQHVTEMMLYITPSIARSRAGGLNAGACDIMMSLQEIVCQLAILKIWMHLLRRLWIL